jgi:D-alanyl-lipoteichoic acid acyltransferase DltB (MBOAT superfamily)
MHFISYEFLGFCTIIFTLSIFLKKRVSTYKYLILFACILFYSSTGFNYLGLLATSTIINYFILKRITKSKSKKRFLVFGLVINVTYLGFFKYYEFFGLYNLLEAIQLQSSLTALDKIILPLGISFYTFRIISHLIDCHRNQQQCPSFLDYALYVSYFPQMISGPIARANEFYTQLNSRQKYQYQIETVITLIISGLFKLYVLSSFLYEIKITQEPFDLPGQFSSFDLILSALAYSCYIYVNFSGYSDLANAISSLLGFKPIQNFNMPYCAKSLQEFWRRWHISLSEWLRDYLYIPLGGGKKGQPRKYLNLLLTMIIGGFWHGASLNFIIWGGLHGLGLIINHLWKDYCRTIQISSSSAISRPKTSFQKIIYSLTQFCYLIYTFSFVTLCWIFFECETYDNAILFFQVIFNFNSGVSVMKFNFWQLYVVFFIVFLMNFAGDKISKFFSKFLSNKPAVLQAILIAALLQVIFKLGPDTVPHFIYRNF